MINNKQKINYLFNNKILQKRFLENPEIEAVSILLQETMPEMSIITKEKKEIYDEIWNTIASKNTNILLGYTKENAETPEEIKLEELVEGVSFLAGYLNPVTFYGYTDESKTPVKHNSNLVHSQELYKLLRGE